MAFRRVAHVREIPEGRGHCVRVGGLEVGLFRVGAEVHALENRCPHAESPLSEGSLDGPVIVCAAHGWRFDVRTGFRPESPDGWPIPCFAVRVVDGEIWIDVESPLNLRRRREPAPKPFSQACENNKRPILEVLRRHLGAAREVLEIGSGTGQHAVFFAEQLPQLVWRTSELPEQHAGILRWLDEAKLDNARPPIALDVGVRPWPCHAPDAVFSANTAHILSWPLVEALVAEVGRLLAPGGVFLLYGPFNRGGTYTSESNARFDAWLRQRDPASGLRSIEDLDGLAEAAGLRRVEDAEMPANNRLLVWRRHGGVG